MIQSDEDSYLLAIGAMHKRYTKPFDRELLEIFRNLPPLEIVETDKHGNYIRDYTIPDKSSNISK